MLGFLIQIWGGLGYLLNKICFSQAERAKNTQERRSWLIRSWIVYIAGLPAWVIVFVSERNWIAAGIESGGAPAMVGGLIVALRGHGTLPKWLDTISKAGVFIGIIASIYEFGGFTTVKQFLELGIAAGFLMGTYLMAKDKVQGYIWLIFGNVCCALLMGIQGFFILMLQQLISLFFVTDALISRKRRQIGESGIVKLKVS